MYSADLTVALAPGAGSVSAVSGAVSAVNVSFRGSRTKVSAAVLSCVGALRSCGVLGRAVVLLSVGTLGLAGCGYFDAGQSGGVDAASSVSVEKVMSGGYEVGPDGKLLNPNSLEVGNRPPIPAAMNNENAEGAEAFAKYYLASYSYSRKTGDVEQLKEFTHPDCEWCQENIQKIEDVYADKGWVEAEDFVVEKTVEVLDFSPIGHDIWHVSMEVASPTHTVYNGKKIAEYPEEKFTLILQSKFTSKGWRMWEGEGKVRE